jgi:surfactin synthase thioesterase subunit
MNDLIPVLADALKPYLLDPYVFFGHSLGAAVGYELLKEIGRRGLPLPDQLYVPGRRAPQLSSRRPITNALSDAEFIKEVRRLGGTSSAVLGNRELMGLLLPTLRTDFEVSETYMTADDTEIETPVFAFTGSDDIDTTLADVNTWSHETQNFGGTVVLSGGHFFLLHTVIAFCKKLLANSTSSRRN